MGLLMTQLVSVAREHSRQVKAAETKETAVRAMERLLADWFRRPEAIPRSGLGSIAGSELHWKSAIVSRKLDRRLGADVLQVSLFDSTDSEAPAVTSCEILIPALPDVNSIIP
jgi:serine/threonine protein kinase HipA of HipAB toxin-antitoxin module